MTFVDRDQRAGVFDVWHEVPLVQQFTGMSCWAAAAAMVLGWRDCEAVDGEDVAAGAGRWRAYRDGLEPRDVDGFARAWGLVVARPELSVPALRALLEAHGPLWVGEASPSLHVVVLAGMYGDGTPERTFVRIADPWPIGRGERYTIPFAQFRANLMSAAALAGGRPQFLHAAPGLRGASARHPTWSSPMNPQVILDPGHGGTVAYGNSSPFGFTPPGGLTEKHANLDLAQRVAARLGAIAQLTRDSDVNLSLRERAEAAARAGARVLVSLHASSGDGETGGSEVWIHERHGRGSAALAEDLHASLDRLGPARVMEGPLAVLDPAATGPCAACLIEADTLDRRRHGARELDELADAIAYGVRSYLGRYGNGIAVRETSAPGQGMNQRYRGDQNIGYVPFHGVMTARHDYTHGFVWLVWPHRRNAGDAAASVDIDVTFELFDQDPQGPSGATPIDTQLRRVQLREDQKFGYEYSRLTSGTDYYLRITYADYGQAQDAGTVLWTNGYG